MNTAKLRPLLGPGLATLVMLAILIWLGTWQLHRRAWKAGILADIDRAELAPPVSLGQGTPPPFTKVSVSGMLAAPAALYGAELRDDGPVSRLGAQVIELLQRPGQPPLLVDLGWVAGTHIQDVHPITGPATITAYVRATERAGWLSATDDLPGRHFYTLNPATIGRALGVPGAAPFTLVALTLVAGGNPLPGKPIPAETLPRPPDNHLQYALTWFGLAATLTVIFLTWARARL